MSSTMSSTTRAVLTVATPSLLPAASVLAGDCLRHDPGLRVLGVCLGETPPGGVPFEVVGLEALSLPGAGTFQYRHPITVLREAIRPAAMRHALDTLGCERVVWVDPETRVLRPLTEAWRMLEAHDAVLVPRTLGPESGPGPGPAVEQRLFAQGLFADGFLGLRRGAGASRLLDLWEEWICRTSPPAGAFGRWLDLVPQLFQRAGVLRDPGYNAGAGNLHERSIAVDEGGFRANGRPLVTFDASGFAVARAFRPGTGMPGLADLPAVRALCEQYAGALHGFERPDAAVDRELRLANGVAMSRAACAVVDRAARDGIAMPSPGVDADGFCQFLMRPNASFSGTDIAPLASALLDLRPDLARAFPGARHDKRDRGLRDWFSRHGAEEHLDALVENHGHWLDREDGASLAFAVLDRRPDLGAAYPAVHSDRDDYLRFGEWLERSGPEEEGFDALALAEYRAAEDGVARVLDAFFIDPALMARLPLVHGRESVAALVEALLARMPSLPWLGRHDLARFERAAPAEATALLLACLRYNPAVRREIGGLPSAFNLAAIAALLRRHGLAGCIGQVQDVLLRGEWLPPVTQLHAFVESERSLPRLFPGVGTSAVAAEACANYVLDRHGFAPPDVHWAGFARALLDSIREPVAPGFNVAGPFWDASGMGEWGRSLLRIVDATGLPRSVAVLPARSPSPGAMAGTRPEALFGGFDPRHRINLFVANADTRDYLQQWHAGPHVAGRINVACWVWETEQLPLRFRDAALGMDLVIAPSRYAADAIARTVAVPVQCLPPALDFARLDAARADRARFGLPEDVLLLGFFFDINSITERKNPAGLIDAFRTAFGARRDVGLVLKVNSAERDVPACAHLRQRAQGCNVFFIEQTLDTAGALDLMASLDAYVSLHRAEGYGLTMAEAMYLRKPVVATGYSGNIDFMDADTALLVDHDIVATTVAHGPYPAGTRWAEPRIESCVRQLRALEDAALRKALGARARARVGAELDPARLARRLLDILDAAAVARSGTDAGSTLQAV